MVREHCPKQKNGTLEDEVWEQLTWLKKCFSPTVVFLVSKSSSFCEFCQEAMFYEIRTRMNIKRKLSDENRVFNSTWKERYLVTENNSRPQYCASPGATAVQRKRAVNSHYQINHEKMEAGRYTGSSREAILRDSNGKHCIQTNLTIDFAKLDLASLRASYEVALTIAGQGNAFWVEQILKNVFNQDDGTRFRR